MTSPSQTLKNNKGVLGRLRKGRPEESTEDILVDLKKAEIKSRDKGKRKATQEDMLAVQEEREMHEEVDLRQDKATAGKSKKRPDIEVEGLKSATDIMQEVQQKAANKGSRAFMKNVWNEHRRDEALKTPERLTPAVRAAMQEHMAQEGAKYREALQPKLGFEEEYDATTEFQEEEYGGGSLKREMVLSEILGEDWRTKRDPARREDLQSDGTFSFDGFLEKAKAANPEGREEDWQDAAIKEYYKAAASKASNEADKFDDVEDTAQASGQMVNYAEEKKETPVLSENARSKLPRANQSSETPETPIQKAARRYVESSYGPDKEASKSKLARIQETTDARKRNLPDETSTDEDVGGPTMVKGASEGLYNSIPPNQRQGISSQPQGANFAKSLEALSNKNLDEFNETFGASPKGFLAGVGGASMYRDIEGFISKLSPELTQSIAVELQPLVSQAKEAYSSSYEQGLHNELSTAWAKEKGFLSEDDLENLNIVSKRISDLLSPEALQGLEVNGGMRNMPENVRLVVNQLLKDAGGDFLQRKDLFGRPYRYLEESKRKTPLLTAIGNSINKLPALSMRGDVRRGEGNLKVLGVVPKRQPAVLEVGDETFDQLLSRARGSEVPDESPVIDIIAAAEAGE